MPTGQIQQSDRHPQQQYIPTTGLNGNWQSDKDMPHRREMIQHIVKMLKKDKNGSPEWLSKLPQMAKQLEVSLYRNARSFEAYADMNTLKHRLQAIAIEVSKKAKDQQGGRPDSRSDRQYPNGMRSSSQSRDMMRSGSASSASTHRHSNTTMSTSQQPQSHRHVVNMDEINPSLGGTSSSNYGSSSRPGSSSSRDFANGSSGRSSSGQGGGSSLSPPGQNRNDPDWKTRIRHKQQRLLLLHHSAKCPHEDGKCTVTPHCADMKKLWRHMEGCKDNNCRVHHCFSSRAILSHYRKCKDRACPACGPVRETVRKGQTSKSSSSSSQSRGMINAQDQQSLRPSSSSGGHSMMSFSADPRSISSTPPVQNSQAPPPPIEMMNNNVPGGSFSSSSSVPGSFQQPPRQPQSHSSMPPPASGQNFTSSMPPYHSNRNESSSMSQSSSQQVQPLYKPPSTSAPAPSSSDPFASNLGDSSELSISSSSMPPNGSGASSGGQRRNDSEWQRVRHKQQRLLLLRHASKCQYESGKCPVTPHCASMKKLWEHIAHCKNQQCTVQHCMSSRYVLSHYRRCKDARCPACGPVRDTIRKTHEKERQKQKQQQQQQQQQVPVASSSIPFPNEPTSSSGRSSSASNQLSSGHGARASSTSPTSSSQFQPVLKKAKVEHTPSIPPSITPSSSSMPVKSKTAKESKPATKVVSSSASAPSGKKATKQNEDHSLINSFTVEQIEKHVASLDRKLQLPPAKLKSKCLEVLKGLQQHQHGWVFNTPVDPVELGLPDYFVIIKKPMDLGTVNKRIENGSYHFIEEFEADVRLTFENAMTYNEEGSVVHDMAKELKEKFAVDYKKLVLQLENEDRERRQNDRACTLCGCEKLLFEPPVYFCNGMNCASKRIRRNSHFYVGGNGQYFWCNTCYNELDGSIPIELSIDLSVQKADLTKKKNDESHEESWVQCDSCEKWIHQICGLFNTRQNKEHHSKYHCPKCLLENRKKLKGDKPEPKPAGAEDLPRTILSEWLEKHVKNKVAEKRRELAEEKAAAEKIPVEEAMKTVDKGGRITIRQVTSTDRKHEVRELMKARYAFKNYPDEFGFRCKCLVVFQNLDGVDVVLFALYVYEHGEDNPAPNNRCVYISYLDSVHFMRPRKLRTTVYHEILIAYLDYVRQKGYVTAHIWACPPLKGDDYIFYAKPEDQKTPRDARLKQWYIDMLTECQKRNIAGKVTNMYDLYFSNYKLDATAVPYLEGDYFPGEAENIIKDLKEGNGKKAGGTGGKKKKKQSKAKNNRGTRATGLDEDALAASGIFEHKSIEEGGRDQVMIKMGETIQPMKESFIVAYLNHKDAKSEDMVVPEEIVKYREEAAEKKNSSKKRDASGNIRGISCLKVTDMKNLKDSNGQRIKLIDDDAEEMDCEFFNNRQAFLNLCRGNHYQFDELRRAKHTSMMVLWHLHNRDAPKFVQQCVSCAREILTGNRYHCNTCPDYDLCEDCYKNPNANRGACSHKLQAIPVETNNNEDPQAGNKSGLTEAQRKERQRNLLLHIQLIEHAARCNDPSCTSSNCAKMKSYLNHGRVCKVRASGGCKICKRIWTLLRIHAQKCKDTVCPVPQCMAIRERIRQLAKQQQAMDDRRRQEMNRMRMSMNSG